LTIFFVSSGFFFKYFSKLKKIKNQRTLLLLSSNLFKKIFLISDMSYLNFILNNISVDFFFFLKLLNMPLLKSFNNPVFDCKVEEGLEIDSLMYNFIIFKYNTFKNLKLTRGKGRIKRKVLKKLIVLNKLLD
jgi:hypothetical protein